MAHCPAGIDRSDRGHRHPVRPVQEGPDLRAGTRPLRDDGSYAGIPADPASHAADDGGAVDGGQPQPQKKWLLQRQQDKLC